MSIVQNLLDSSPAFAAKITTSISPATIIPEITKAFKELAKFQPKEGLGGQVCTLDTDMPPGKIVLPVNRTSGNQCLCKA